MEEYTIKGFNLTDLTAEELYSSIRNYVNADNDGNPATRIETTPEHKEDFETVRDVIKTECLGYSGFMASFMEACMQECDDEKYRAHHEIPLYDLKREYLDAKNSGTKASFDEYPYGDMAFTMEENHDGIILLALTDKDGVSGVVGIRPDDFLSYDYDEFCRFLDHDVLPCYGMAKEEAEA